MSSPRRNLLSVLRAEHADEEGEGIRKPLIDPLQHLASALRKEDWGLLGSKTASRQNRAEGGPGAHKQSNTKLHASSWGHKKDRVWQIDLRVPAAGAGVTGGHAQPLSPIYALHFPNEHVRKAHE